ncbi:MAG: endonuclease, partial [archaeon]
MNEINKIYKTLLKDFGPQGWWPVTDKKNAQFEIIAGAILTQNTSWKNVEKSIKKLKEENLLIREAIIKIDNNKLSQYIKSSGYYN